MPKLLSVGTSYHSLSFLATGPEPDTSAAFIFHIVSPRVKRLNLNPERLACSLYGGRYFLLQPIVTVRTWHTYHQARLTWARRPNAAVCRQRCVLAYIRGRLRRAPPLSSHPNLAVLHLGGDRGRVQNTGGSMELYAIFPRVLETLERLWVWKNNFKALESFRKQA